MDLDSVSKTFLFVFFAYAAAFAPWSVLSAKDFISSTWKSVRATRQAGYIHFVIGLVPAVYVAAYAVIKLKVEDFEESCAALVAFCFALWHILLTLWGLWQLAQFRKWAEESVKRVEEMGLKYKLYEQLDLNASEIANEILVNNSIIDNQISHGEAHCYLRYGDAEVLKPWKNKEFMQWKEVFKGRWLYGRILQWCRLIGLICVDTVRTAVGLKKWEDRKLAMVPVSPVKLWVRWALAFAGQGLGEWMRDFSMPQNPDVEGFSTNMSAEEKMKKRGEFFGSEVLLSAALQLWNEVDGREDKLGPFLLNGWEKDGRNMADGRFVKEELLKVAVSSGNALPFQASQMEVMRHTKRSSGWQGPSYDKYREAVKKGIEGLPEERVYLDEVRKFNVEMLEWLTIVLHLGVMSLKSHEASGQRLSFGGMGDFRAKNEKQRRRTKKRNQMAALNLCAQLNIGESGVVSSKKKVNDEGGVVSSKKQMDGDSWVGRASRAVNAFPGLNKVVGLTSKGGNRHVTMMGEMVDVWMALVAGEQMSFLVEELNRNWENLCLGHEKNEAVLTKADAEENMSAVKVVNATVEQRRLATRVANKRHRYRYREQFVTFMGYRMEAVRTAIGQWVSRNRGSNADELFKNTASQKGNKNIFENLGSALCLLLKASPGVRVWRRRGVQCRLIWELQNALEARVNNAVKNANKNESEDKKRTEDRESTVFVQQTAQHGVEVAMLTVLSFPSLEVSVTEVNKNDEERESEKSSASDTHVDMRSLAVARTKDGGDVEHLTIRIEMRAVCGPQNITVVADIGSSGTCELQLRGGDVEFKWRLWRDAFHGRVEGLWKWQKEHGITGVEVLVPRGGNSRMVGGAMEEIRNAVGKGFHTWKEWRPFRVRFCRFEMESEGFLEQPSVSGHVSRAVTTQASVDLIDLPVRTIGKVKYEDADEVVLANSCVLMEEAVQRMEVVNESIDVPNSGKRTADVKALKNIAERRQKDGQKRQALLMYETAAIQYGDPEAVAKSIDIVMKERGKLVADERRGAEILRAFVGNMLSEGSQQSELTKDQMNMMRDTVLPQCKKLLDLWGDREDVCIPLMDLLKLYMHLVGGSKEDNTRGLLSGQRMLFLPASERDPRAVLFHIAILIELLEAKAKS